MDKYEQDSSEETVGKKNPPRSIGEIVAQVIVLTGAIILVATILFPVFAKHPGPARSSNCTGQVRQIAMAIQMYMEDHQGQFPGVDGSSWVSKLTLYVGTSDKMFHCPDDPTTSSSVSYGYNSLMVQPDGKGIMKSNVLSPSEMGIICDTTPSTSYPDGRLVETGLSLSNSKPSVQPCFRHRNGIIVGFADGSARYIEGQQNSAQNTDWRMPGKLSTSQQ